MKTTLYDSHVALGGKMVEFAGWEMPIQYSGILVEHKAVREGVGIFDVSHMGRIIVEGTDAEKFLDSLSTNKIVGKSNRSATYTVLPNEAGTCVDDVIIYKESPTHFFLIVNAGNRQKDLTHLKQHAAPYQVTIQDRFNEEGILSIQGPQSFESILKLFPEVSTLRKMQHLTTGYKGTPLIIATTGYTGEVGVEIYAPNTILKELWDHFITAGAVPIGLGARDTLRLEMGFALYGHELSEHIFPTESVSSWTVKKNERDFLGKTVMLKRETSAQQHYQRGVILEDKGIPREGYPVLSDGIIVGKVLSGTFSPTLEKGIAIVQLDKPVENYQAVEIQVRQQQVKGKIVPLPFLQR